MQATFFQLASKIAKKPGKVTKYLSYWNFALVSTHKYTARYINLLVFSALVFCYSLWISYGYPGFYQINKHYIISGWRKSLVDVLFHFGPFAFVFLMYGKYYLTQNPLWSWQTANALIIMLIYLALFDPVQVYGTNITLLYIIFITMIALGLCTYVVEKNI